MLLDNFCALGATQKEGFASNSTNQIYYYETDSLNNETIADVLSANFFNPVYDRLKVNDIILIYSPSESWCYVRVSNNVGGIVTVARILIKDIDQIDVSWGNITGDIEDQTDLQEALDDKQDTLTAGTGISIASNVISCNINAILQYSTMPTASASNLGQIVQYSGLTTSDYTEGYFYQCLGYTTTTPALVTVSTSGTAGLGTVTCNADTYGNEVGHIPYECNFVFRGYPTVIVIRDEEESATTLTLTRDTESDTNDMYAWTISSDNSTVWSDTREAEANTMFYDLPQGGLCQYCPDEVTVSSRTTGLDGRWQQDLGDDYYDDATISDYGISYDGVALVGARIETTYRPASNTGNTTYSWTQIDVQPSTEVLNNVTSTSTTSALSANMGKELQQQINHLESIGRFLSFWNCATGLPTTSPTTSPYTYKTGDYYRVSTVSSGTNYKPNGSSYTTGVASTTVESNPVQESQIYYYDGSSWNLAGGGTTGTDDTTIHYNSDNNLEVIGVKDQKTSNADKLWTGTLAEYNALSSKDSNTFYHITDDTSGSVLDTVLATLYPVGSIYIGTQATCPLSTLISGSTWELVGADKVLQGAGTRGSVGTTLSESLPNITGNTNGTRTMGISASSTTTGSLYFAGVDNPNALPAIEAVSNYNLCGALKFDASRSSSTYQDNAPVQPDAYLVNIWRRTA